MLELYDLHQDFDTCVRLLAAEIQHRKATVQFREIAAHAGRMAEQARCAGAQRWQAVKLEDDFKAAVRARLDELERQAGTVIVVRNVVPLRREGAAA